ncbi:MAG: hypothetical protein RLY84_597 [Actinomycetota bacterium]
MKKLTELGQDPDPRFTLANERTFLAWIRTSMALILGAVVVATLLSEIAFLENLVAPLAALLSLLGGSLALWAWFRWRRTETALRLGKSIPLSRVLLLLAAVLALLGLGMVVIGIFLASS